MAIQTNTQRMAQTSYEAIVKRTRSLNKEERDKYGGFARSFPSLVHSCGLAQAVAFAQAKDHGQYLEDLAAVLRAVGHSEADSPEALEQASRDHPVPTYIRLSRHTLLAAGWLKRYIEALKE